MEHLVRGWDEKAEDWHRHIGPAGDANRRFNVDPVIWRLLGDVAGKAVLDAGCGTGYLALQLVERGAAVLGVDWSPGMIEVARRQAGLHGVDVELRVDDCQTLETVPSASVDALVNNYVLQDLPDLPRALAAFRRVLRPDGFAVIVLGHPCFNPPFGASYTDGSATYHWTSSYFDEWEARERWPGSDHTSGERIEFESDFVFFHRPLSAYWRAFVAAGFEVADLVEPVVEPPYPADLEPERADRYRMCPFSIAFSLRVSPPGR